LNLNLSRDLVGRLGGFSQVAACVVMALTARAWLIPLLILTASCSRQQDSKPSAAQPRVIYATPAAVFDAYREASQKREWRKCFDCLTPDTQKKMMFELCFSCGEVGSERATLIVQKFVVDTW
jgi:hypothetical protein